MTANDLIADLHRRGVELIPEGATLRYRAARGVLTKQDREAMTFHKKEVLRLLTTRSVLSSTTTAVPPATTTPATAPTTAVATTAATAPATNSVPAPATTVPTTPVIAGANLGPIIDHQTLECKSFQRDP